MKVIGRLPGERSCHSLVWAVLDRGPRGVDMNPANVRLLQQIRRDLLAPKAADDPQPEPAEHDLPDAVTPAA